MKSPMERVAEAKSRIKEISVAQLSSDEVSNCTIIDVREPQEHQECSIRNCINIPRGVLEFEVLKHCETEGTNTELVLYCKTGGRSALAAEALLDLGFVNVVSLAGGIEAWKTK